MHRKIVGYDRRMRDITKSLTQHGWFTSKELLSPDPVQAAVRFTYVSDIAIIICNISNCQTSFCGKLMLTCHFMERVCYDVDVTSSDVVDVVVVDGDNDVKTIPGLFLTDYFALIVKESSIFAIHTV